MQELHLHTCVTGRIYSLETEGISKLDEQVGGIDLLVADCLDRFCLGNGRRNVVNNTVGDVDRIAERECAVGNQRIEQLVADGCATE